MKRTGLACVAALLVAAGSSGPPAADESVSTDVVEPLAEGHLDWSSWRLHVHTRSDMVMGAWEDRRLQEQDALDRLRPRLEELAGQVRVTPDSSAADLMGGDDELSRRLHEGLRRWNVDETTYLSSGGVEMRASLDLHEWLRPALVALASSELPELPEGAPSGLIVDVRGLSFRPSLAPTIRTPEGEAVARAQLIHEDTARLSSPVVFVRDPADAKAIARVGTRPLFARAAQSRGGELVLDAESAIRLSAESALPALVARGSVALVVSP